MSNKQIIIIGSGPSGLMAAQELAKKGFAVKVYEQNKAAARKFLVAGNGGFNLTHNEDIIDFVEKYDRNEIKTIVKNFDNKKVIAWLSEIGIETYVGSSGKIFPLKSIKPIQVLNAWLIYLKDLGVELYYNHTFINFDENNVQLKTQDQTLFVPYTQLILAMGGGSWKKTGSDTKWVSVLENKNIEITALEAANSGYNTHEQFHNLEGEYLKNVKVSFGEHHKLGEVVFTNYGIEGSAIYFLNRFTRSHAFPLILNLDLKPNLSQNEILDLLKNGGNIASILKNKLKLSNTALSILKNLSKEDYTNPEKLSGFIKKYPVELLSYRPIDEVISTSGGVTFDELKHTLELKKRPNIYCIGEMLDWEAPTGGYLLQACFSTGYWAAHAIIEK